MEVEEQIRELNEFLDEAAVEMDKLTEGIKTLKNQSSIDQATIAKQKKELKDLEKKLFGCSNDRDEIQGKLDEKVAELEKSNLSKEQIAEQTIHLLTKSGFVEVRDKLMGV